MLFSPSPFMFDTVVSYRAVSFKDPSTAPCLSLHLWRLILSQFLSVSIKPSTDSKDTSPITCRRGQCACRQLPSTSGPHGRQQGVLEFPKGSSGGLDRQVGLLQR